MIRGWCPGVLRPMASGDGLIVRLRLTGGIVGPDLARRIAHWSRQWGNGQIELSNRANLQLRGLSIQHIPKLQDALADAGLLDRTAEAEAVRNVVISPLAGLDPVAWLDIRPIATALEHRLATDHSLHGLPGKFGFAIDDGGRFSLDDVPADVRFVAGPGPAFSVHLAGAPGAFSPCPPDAVPDIAARIVHAFLRYHGARRMRDVAAATIAAEAGLSPIQAPPYLSPPHLSPPHLSPPHLSPPHLSPPHLSPPHLSPPHLSPPHLSLRGAIATRQSRSVVAPDCRVAIAPRNDSLERPPPAGHRENCCLGTHLVGDTVVLGIGLPFGQITAEGLADLAGLAGDLRLTPWRAILIPTASLAAAQALQARLADQGFILDPSDPRRRVAACSGAPACPSATTATRDDATALAAHVRPGRFLHVSGCAKGCAHPGPAAITLVAHDGRYDLIRNGSASAAPAMRGLTAAQAAEHIA